MKKKLIEVIESLDTSNIPEDRKVILKKLIDYIQKKIEADKPVRLNFICTHNSRRSHLSQVWMQTMANYFKINNIFCYSGGTEATAIYSSTVETLRGSGFDILKLSNGDNPIYSIKYDKNEPPIIAFSKVFESEFNPSDNFAAIMTCSQVEQECPYVPLAEIQIPITFEDPKSFDNTPLEKEKYNERSLHIATEFFYVLSKIKK